MTARESPGADHAGAGKPQKRGAGFDQERTTHPGHDQPSLEDALEDARQARDAGASDALNAAHGWVRVHLEEHLDELIRERVHFTAEDLRARAGTPLASSPNTIGSVILAASKKGRIECTGYRESTRPEARCRILRVWQGVGHVR